MSTPLVSVIIATWNTGAYLSQTLQSALSQTWRNLEVILVDDGSTDDTTAIAARYLPRIRYERRNHLGLAAARNEGIRLARGDYIALLDADDLWDPQKLAIQLAIAARHPSSGFIASDAEEFCDEQLLRAHTLPEGFFAEPPAEDYQTSSTGEVTGDFQRALIARNLINCPAQVLLPREVVERTGQFIDSGAQDYDYYLRVSRNHPVTFHREVLTSWRFREDSMSGPRVGRNVRWGTDRLSVLLAHRERCRLEDQVLLRRQIRRAVRSLGHDLMRYGRRYCRQPVASRLVRLFLANPWQPTLLTYLLGLWSPQTIYRIGAWINDKRYVVMSWRSRGGVRAVISRLVEGCR